MATGNEFQQPGEREIRETGEKHAGNMQRETQGKEHAGTSYEGARQAAMKACGDDQQKWFGSNDKAFHESTEAHKAGSPEQIKQAMADNQVKIEALQKHIEATTNRVAHVLKAQATHEAIERANRTA